MLAEPPLRKTVPDSGHARWGAPRPPSLDKAAGDDGAGATGLGLEGRETMWAGGGVWRHKARFPQKAVPGACSGKPWAPGVPMSSQREEP